MSSSNPTFRPKLLVIDGTNLVNVVPDYIDQGVLSEMIYQVFDDYINCVKFDPNTPPSVIPSLALERIPNRFKLTNGDAMQLQGVFKDVYVGISQELACTGVSLLVDEEGSLDYAFDQLLSGGSKLLLKRLSA